jgi:replicative DNA helicase
LEESFEQPRIGARRARGHYPGRQAIFSVSEILTAEDLYLEAHREIFRAMLALAEEKTSMRQVWAKARRLALEHGFDLLVWGSGHRYEFRTQEVTEISRAP